jgi:hypothetical protein
VKDLKKANTMIMTIDQNAIAVDEKIDINIDAIANDLPLVLAHLDAIAGATLTQIVTMSAIVVAVDIDIIAVVATDTIVLIITTEAEEGMLVVY